MQAVHNMSCRLNDMNEKLKRIARENDIFTPDFSSVPKLRIPVHLDFSTRNTVEGTLKAEVLGSANYAVRRSENVYGRVMAVFGVAGMGGVGKTTALLGLAQDPDVREAFSRGGIYFLVVGKNASPIKLVTDLKDIIRCSGGEKWSEKIDNNVSLESAVRTTSSWFAQRKALFILDDLWQTSSNPLGYFEVLMGLLDDSPDSHMLISTRSNTISSETGTQIEFEPRENTGSEALGMFLESAGLGERDIQDSNCEKLVEEVLKLCGGVPLMLSIAGAQVRGRAGTHTTSLKYLLHSLNDERVILPKEQPGQYPSCFHQAVQLSLETIADVLKSSTKFMESWNEQPDYNPNRPAKAVLDFVINCFHRLCILPRNARVSKDVIFAIWCGPNKTVAWSVIDSLVDFHLFLEFKDGQGKSTFGLHDVILDYCEKISQVGRNRKYELYHREFLSHTWSMFHQSSSSVSSSSTADTREECNTVLDAFWVREACERCRPWWRMLSSSDNELSEMKSYLLDNLHRHLKESCRFAEAVGVLSHMGWTKMRVAQGSIVALNLDYSFVETAIRLHPRSQQDCQECDETLHGISNIWNMLKKAWPVLLNNSEALPTHAYGYLLDKKNVPLVERYLQSASDILTGLWFKPKSAFWSMLYSSGNSRVFRTISSIREIVALMRPHTMIVATRATLFWVDMESMIVTREMVIRNESQTQSYISAFTFCEGKGVLVIGYSTGELELRNARNGNILRAIPNAHEKSVDSVAICAEGRRMVSGSVDKTLQLWDAETGTPICHPLLGHENFVRSVAISTDGRTVVSGSWDKTVRLWNAENGTPIGPPLHGHDDYVMSVAISRDGRIVASGSADKSVRLWDVENGTPIGEPFRGHKGWVRCVAISTDGRTVVSGSGGVEIMRISRLADGTPPYYKTILIDSDDETIRMWDVESGNTIGEPLNGYDGPVVRVALSADGRTVVSGSHDGTVRLWDAESATAAIERWRGHKSPVRSLAISADGQLVVSGGHDGTLRLWDAESEAQIGQPLRAHTDKVLSVAMSADGRRAVSGSADKTVRLWDTENGSPIGQPLCGHEGDVLCVAITADGRRVASSSIDKTVRLWNAESGTPIGEPLRGHEESVRCVAISANGRMVVSGSNDKTVRLWDAETGTPIGQPLHGHEDVVWCVAISTNGRTVVSGAHDDGTVRLWNTENGAPIGKLLIQRGSFVKSVAISADGRMVLCRSYYGTVRIWNQDTSGTHWVFSTVRSIPTSLGWCMAFTDGDQCSGVAGKLVCPLLGGVMVFELVRP